MTPFSPFSFIWDMSWACDLRSVLPRPVSSWDPPYVSLSLADDHGLSGADGAVSLHGAVCLAFEIAWMQTGRSKVYAGYSGWPDG